MLSVLCVTMDIVKALDRVSPFDQWLLHGTSAENPLGPRNNVCHRTPCKKGSGSTLMAPTFSKKVRFYGD